MFLGNRARLLITGPVSREGKGTTIMKQTRSQGGVCANFARPRDQAFANPGATPTLLVCTCPPIQTKLTMEDFKETLAHSEISSSVTPWIIHGNPTRPTATFPFLVYLTWRIWWRIYFQEVWDRVLFKMAQVGIPNRVFGRFVRPLQRLVLNYCQRGGSSRGIR